MSTEANTALFSVLYEAAGIFAYLCVLKLKSFENITFLAKNQS